MTNIIDLNLNELVEKIKKKKFHRRRLQKHLLIDQINQKN